MYQPRGGAGRHLRAPRQSAAWRGEAGAGTRPGGAAGQGRSARRPRATRAAAPAAGAARRWPRRPAGPATRHAVVAVREFPELSASCPWRRLWWGRWRAGAAHAAWRWEVGRCRAITGARAAARRGRRSPAAGRPARAAGALRRGPAAPRPRAPRPASIATSAAVFPPPGVTTTPVVARRGARRLARSRSSAASSPPTSRASAPPGATGTSAWSAATSAISVSSPSDGGPSSAVCAALGPPFGAPAGRAATWRARLSAPRRGTRWLSGARGG